MMGKSKKILSSCNTKVIECYVVLVNSICFLNEKTSSYSPDVHTDILLSTTYSIKSIVLKQYYKVTVNTKVNCERCVYLVRIF